MKHHSKAVDYSDLDYEAIHKEIMADEDAVGAKADGKVEKWGEGKGLEDAQATPLDEPLVDPPVDQAANLDVIDPAVWILICALFFVCLCFRASSRLCFDKFSSTQFLLFLSFVNNLELRMLVI